MIVIIIAAVIIAAVIVIAVIVIAVVAVIVIAVIVIAVVAVVVIAVIVVAVAVVVIFVVAVIIATGTCQDKPQLIWLSRTNPASGRPNTQLNRSRLYEALRRQHAACAYPEPGTTPGRPDKASSPSHGCSNQTNRIQKPTPHKSVFLPSGTAGR